MKNFFTKSGRKITYFGNTLGDLPVKNTSLNPNIKTLDDLFFALLNSFSMDTIHSSHRTEYDIDNNPTFCHCTLTSIIVFDFFGGEIVTIKVPGGGVHHLNRIDGHIIDLTSDQFTFKDITLDYSEPVLDTKENALSNLREKERYDILLDRVKNFSF
ncbi:hypothetical protein IKG45_01945 [Candidatus Saccharibacteria bacterium]|nr:hypothetical protein [Candidatus Saccharibacteria bacterium]